MLCFLFAQKLERGHFYKEKAFWEAFEAENQSELGADFTDSGSFLAR